MRIGQDVLIKGGVTIGNGAVIGVRSVVTKNVPPYAVVAGVPARVIKYRFEKEITRFREKWEDQLKKGDPYYSPNLSVTEGDCSLRED